MKLTNAQLNRNLVTLFNTVLEVASAQDSFTVLSSGIVIKGKMSQEAANAIAPVLEAAKIFPEDLAKTFYQTWGDVENRSRLHILIDQLNHYASTYGTGFTGTIHLDNPGFGQTDEYAVHVIRTVSHKQAIQLAAEMLNSGVALKTETVSACLNILDTLGGLNPKVSFANQEANALLVKEYGFPARDVNTLMRLIFEKATGRPMVVKSKSAISQIKENQAVVFEELEKFVAANGKITLAEAFNRLKPVLLAMRYNASSKTLINQIAKLSKKHHKPFEQSVINLVTQKDVTGEDFSKVTVFALLRAMNTIYLRLKEGPSSVRPVYRIRNGRTHVGEERDADIALLTGNYLKLREELSKRVKGAGRKVYIPEGVDYGLPTSEKSFVGGIPSGTTVYSDEPLSAGVYWENEGGANDLDLSAQTLCGQRVGWNSYYNNVGYTYSGDITNAPKGAVEFMRMYEPKEPALLMLNVFTGKDQSDYKMIIGHPSEKEGMMKYKDLLFFTNMTTPARSSTLGVMDYRNGKYSFTFLESADSLGRVSRATDKQKDIIEYTQFVNRERLGLGEVLEMLDFELVDSPEDAIDLTPANLTAETILGLFQ